MRRLALGIGLLLAAPGAGRAQAELPARGAETATGVLFEELGVRLAQPQLAVRADGALALVCVGEGGAILAATRAPDGEWSTPCLVAREPDLAAGMHRGPRIAWAGETLVVSTICARFDRKARKVVGSGNLSVRRSRDGGRSWSEPLRVNAADGSAAEGLHALAARGERVVLAWLDPRGGEKGARLFAAESSDGGAHFGPDRAVYDSPSGSICECCHPSLALGPEGVCVVMWRNLLDGRRDLYAGSLAPGARALEDVRALGTGHWALAACPMDGGDLALADDGRALAVWRRANEVFYSLGDAHEARLGPGRNPVVARAGTNALAVWEDGGRLWFVRVSLTENRGTSAPRELGEGAFACAAALSDGVFLVAAQRPEVREGGERAGLACFELRSID